MTLQHEHGDGAIVPTRFVCSFPYFYFVMGLGTSRCHRFFVLRAPPERRREATAVSPACSLPRAGCTQDLKIDSIHGSLKIDSIGWALVWQGQSWGYHTLCESRGFDVQPSIKRTASASHRVGETLLHEFWMWGALLIETPSLDVLVLGGLFCSRPASEEPL